MLFSFILQDIHDITAPLSNALFEATGGDIEFSCCEGEAVVDFHRDGPLQKAVEAAIAQVENTGVRVARVEPYSEDRQLFQAVNARLAARHASSAT